MRELAGGSTELLGRMWEDTELLGLFVAAWWVTSRAQGGRGFRSQQVFNGMLNEGVYE